MMFSFCYLIIFRASDIRMIDKRTLLLYFFLERQLVEALFQDGLDAFIRGASDGQSP